MTDILKLLEEIDESASIVAKEALSTERRRVCEPLLAAMSFLETAPDLVKRAFSICIIEILHLPPNATEKRTHDALRELGVSKKAIVAWTEKMVPQ